MSKFIVHSTEDCPYCQIVKGVLDTYEVDYDLVYEKSPEWPTYPCVYWVSEGSAEKVLIGGASELQSFAKSVNIKEM